MAVRVGRTAGRQHKRSRDSSATRAAPGTGPGLTPERVGDLLGKWQKPELRIARGFGECKGLTHPELEDIYQDTVEALLQRRYASEDHLRHALRSGLKHRALRFHRDERRRGEILTENAPLFDVLEQAAEENPERAALAHMDRLIVREFLAELTDLEKRVFRRVVEGSGYRAIASAENIEANEARNIASSCEKKRERFQMLYDNGRLCGYRATTIRALQARESTPEELATRAFAHLESCASCRKEHRTNAARLRNRFQGQATILLPPMVMEHLGWLVRLDARARTLQHRFTPDGLPLGPGGVRERATALLLGTGAAAKLAVGVATVAVIAGSTIGATTVLNHKPTHHHQHHAATQAATPQPDSAISAPPIAEPPAPRTQTHHQQRAASPAHQRAVRRAVPRSVSPTVQREPGGFAYLGVPTEPSSTSPPAAARTASNSSGGPFSP
jgi:DNA-directed RNA polymerase specialized sigma24 family protein